MARPTTPRLSRDKVVEAALELIEQIGLESLTLNNLADHLEVRAPSLYYYFDNKMALLDACAIRLVSDIRLPSADAGQDWYGWFRQMAVNTFRHLLECPRCAGLLLEHLPRSVVLPGHDRGSRLLIDAGVAASDVVGVVRGIEKLTFGLTLSDAAEARDGGTESENVDPDEWPSYWSALEATTRGREATFLETIDIFLDGVASRYLN